MNPTYDITASYQENYDRGPTYSGPLPNRIALPGSRFLGFDLDSTLGIPAGPLLNSTWIALYAALGFDVLTYKTVRSGKWPSHPAPNCLYVKTPHPLGPKDFGGQLQPLGHEPVKRRELSITNSFGMPSMAPEEWQGDIAVSKDALDKGQLLVVSVVGTHREGEDFVEDFARTAAMAREAGAPVVEANFSCPNVTTGEGSIYADPSTAGTIAKALRNALKDIPLILKVGSFADERKLAALAAAVAPHVQAISGINTVSMEVVNPDGTPALGEGRKRSGVCGWAIRKVGLDFVRMLRRVRDKGGYDFEIAGVGGIVQPQDFQKYYDLGADCVQVATGAMWDPLLAAKYKKKVHR